MIFEKAQKGGGILPKVIKIASFISALFLFSCEAKAIRTDRTDNPTVSVDLLLQHDGCKVYRFTDNGHAHYFVKCADTRTATTDSTIQEGKYSRIETIVSTNAN